MILEESDSDSLAATRLVGDLNLEPEKVRTLKILLVPTFGKFDWME